MVIKHSQPNVLRLDNPQPKQSIMLPINMPFKSPFTSSSTNPTASSSQQPTASTSKPRSQSTYSHAHAHGLMERKLSLLLSGCDGGTHDFDRGDEQAQMGGGFGWDAGYDSEGAVGISGWAGRRSSSESAIQTSPSSTPSTSPSAPPTHLSSRPGPKPTPHLQATQTQPNLPASGLSLSKKLEAGGPGGVLVEMRRKNKTMGHFDPSRDARLLAI